MQSFSVLDHALDSVLDFICIARYFWSLMAVCISQAGLFFKSWGDADD